MRIAYKKGYRFQLFISYHIQTPIRPKKHLHSPSGFIELTTNGLLLIGSGYAWDGASPSGILFVDWEGSRAEVVRASFPDCPHLTDLFVPPEYRRRGIATQLLEYVETEARRRGYGRIGLDVDLNLPDYRTARGMYARRGYRDTGIRHAQSYPAVGEDGRETVIQERLRFMVKELGLQSV